MSWKSEAIKEYFKKHVASFSYIQCLHRIKTDIVQNITRRTDLVELDAQLFGHYKALLPENAPANSLRRTNSTNFWDGVLNEVTEKELNKKANNIAIEYEDSALDLVNEAKTRSVSRVMESLNNTESSTHAANLERDDINKSDDPFIEEAPGDIIRTQIWQFRRSADNQTEACHQDLLYNGIIDLAPSSSTKLRAVVNEDELNDIILAKNSKPASKRIITQIDKEDHERKEMKAFASETLANVTKDYTMRQAIKDAVPKKKSDKRCLKILKIIRDTFTTDGSTLYSKQGELHYIVEFLGPIFKILLKKNDSLMLQWGDQALQIEKEEKQKAQKDDERRCSGKVPDAIVSLKEFDIPLCFIEVSGPPCQPNHSHYVGDKKKIAKQLKIVLKKIRSAVSQGDEELYEQVKVLGVQFYLNKFHLYQLSQPNRGIYLFECILSADLACPPGMVFSSVPSQVNNLLKIKTFINSAALSITDYVNSAGGSDSSDNSDDSRDTITVSPKKKQKTRN